MTINSLDDARVVELLQQGAVGVLPTDTIYGLVARVGDSQAVARLYAIKHREGKPGTIIAEDSEQLAELGIDQRYLQAVARYWPNPISIVLPAGEELQYLHQGKDSLAVRIPADPKIRALLRKTGPLLTSSANQPGQEPATNADEAQRYFADEVDFYVEGDTSGRQSSTVARLVEDGTLEVLRQGGVTIN